MSNATILIIAIIGLLLVALPHWPYSRRWGYGPAGLVATALVVIVILKLFRKI